MANLDLTTYLLIGAVAIGGYFLWQNGTFDDLLKGRKKDDEEEKPSVATAGTGQYTKMGVPFIDDVNLISAVKQQQMQQPNLGLQQQPVTVGDMNLGTTPLPNFGGTTMPNMPMPKPPMMNFPGGQVPFSMGGGMGFGKNGYGGGVLAPIAPPPI